MRDSVSFMPSNSAESALRSTGSAAHGATLPQKDRRAKHTDAESGDRDGRHSCKPGTVNANTVAISQPAAITTMTGQG